MSTTEISQHERRVLIALCRDAGALTEDAIAQKAWDNWNKSHTKKRRIPEKVKIVRHTLRGLVKQGMVERTRDYMWGHIGWSPTARGREVVGF